MFSTLGFSVWSFSSVPALIVVYWEWSMEWQTVCLFSQKGSLGKTYRSDGEGALSLEDSELSPGISDCDCHLSPLWRD